MLRSIKQLLGNKLGASDGEIGQVKDFYFDDQNWAIRYLVADTGSWLPGRQVLISPHAFGSLCDFMMDDQSWSIGQLVIKTGHRLSGKEVQIPTSKVDRISWDDSTVFVTLTKAAVEQSPAHHLAPVDAAD